MVGRKAVSHYIATMVLEKDIPGRLVFGSSVVPRRHTEIQVTLTDYTDDDANPLPMIILLDNFVKDATCGALLSKALMNS